MLKVCIFVIIIYLSIFSSIYQQNSIYFPRAATQGKNYWRLGIFPDRIIAAILKTILCLSI